MYNNSFQATQNNINNQPPISFDNGSSQVGAKSHKPLITGVFCGIAGLVLGGLSIFGLTELTKKPVTCPECNCPSQGLQTAPSGLDLDFIKLELANENIIYSPLSIRNGLALLSDGAEGKTAKEINDLLGDIELPVYQNEENTLSLANAVFVRDSFKDYVLPNYISTIESKYNSEVIYDDFSSTIGMDNWVNQKTFGLIDKIDLQVNNETKMVLANALAIQMDWQDSFDSSDTHGSTFYSGDGEEIEATTMHKETTSEDIKYYLDDNFTIISLPLAETKAGTQLEFDAIMPADDLGKYIEGLSVADLYTALEKTISASTQGNGIKISIPKFKFEYKLKFKEDLNSLGIATAFSRDNADFSKMSTKPLYVSDAVHKANIDFSEDGIKAAAVTAFGMKQAITSVEPEGPLEVTINHPFLFVIRDKGTRTIWFTGTVYQPNLWSDDASSYY